MSATSIHGNKQIQPATIQDSNIAAIGTPVGYLGIITAKLADEPTHGFLFRDGTRNMTGPLIMGTGTPTVPAGSQNIQQLADPVNAQDAATKAYVDSKVAGGVVASMTAKVASTVNLTQSGTQTVDGQALVAGDSIMCKDQTTPSQNGVWVVATGVWTRHPSMATWAQVPGMIVSILQGTANHDTVWLSTADPGGTINTTPITFVQIPGPSDVLAGAGLFRTGQVIDVVAADASLTINPDSMAVKLDPARAVTLVAAGIGVNIDATTLDITTNQLRVKPNLFLASSNIIIRETPSGTIDGANAVFNLVAIPTPANTEMVFLNGILQEPGAGNDYTISGLAITFVTAPPVGSRIKANYTNRTGIPT
jgi:hypothetical protein